MTQPPDARAARQMAFFDALPRPLRDAINYGEVGVPMKVIAGALRHLPPNTVAAQFRAKAKNYAALPPKKRGWP